MEIACVCISPADIAHNSSRSMVGWRDQTPKLTVYKADLYKPQVQGSINAAYSRWKPKLVTPHSFTLCHMDLLIQLFDGSRIPAAGSGFWCRQISSLLRHPIVVTFGISSSVQWFSDSPSLFSLLSKLHIYRKSFVSNLGSFSFFPCWGGILWHKYAIMHFLL